jgi:hypothetical protein
MFVTTTNYRGAFAPGGNANAFADNECQTLAQAAGLVGNGPGRNPEFRAWLSTVVVGGPAVNAVSRFTGSSGWIRPRDYKPVMNGTGDLASSKIWYPPRIAQDGTDLGPDIQIWTGTDLNGMYTGQACVNPQTGIPWGNVGPLATIGLSSANGSPITQFVDASCGINRHFLCMGVGRNTSVGAPPAGGKLAFTTEGTWQPAAATGINGADAMCTTEAASAGLPGTYKALLAPNGSTAMGRFNMTNRPWVRVGDRQPITTLEATMYSANTTVLDVAPNATANGNRLGNVEIWTGAASLTAIADSSSSCGDWKNPAEGKGTAGFAFDTGIVKYFFDGRDHNVTCDVQRHVVCLQQ